MTRHAGWVAYASFALLLSFGAASAGPSGARESEIAARGSWRGGQHLEALAQWRKSAAAYRQTGKSVDEQRVIQLAAAAIASQPDEAAARLIAAEAKAAGYSGYRPYAVLVFTRAAELHEGALRFSAAVRSYTAAADLAGNTPPGSQLLASAALAAHAGGDLPAAVVLLKRAEKARDADTNEQSRSQQTIAIAASWIAVGEPAEAVSPLRDIAAWSERNRNLRLRSDAEGYLGVAALRSGDPDSALRRLRQALFYSQATGGEAAYYWMWELARLWRYKGDLPKAAEAYEAAVLGASGAGRRVVAGAPAASIQQLSKLYREAAGLFLELAHTESGAKRQETLKKTRAMLVSVRRSELMAYFGNDCARNRPDKVLNLDAADPRAVIVYPLFLPDRLEVLWSHGGAFDSFVVDAPVAEIRRQADLLRMLVEKRTTVEYRAPAGRLYQLLITPLEKRMAAPQPETIVFVPDGPLHGVPFAALWDGSRFLVERYAVGTAPGFVLHEASLQVRPIRILAAGLSQPVDGYPELRFVPKEIKEVAAFGGTGLLDSQFRLETLQSRYLHGRYTVVHIASHAEFRPTAGSSVILTNHGEVGMNELNDLLAANQSTQPLDLLVLSACDTAVGDERAALGLGGIAVEAGARSALATLWHVDDEATAALMNRFYRQWKMPGVSRSQALRVAQQALLADAWLRHPAYWAPFLMINDWR